MSLKTPTVSPLPKDYTLYLPKKFRHSATVNVDLESIKMVMPQAYQDLLKKMKSKIGDDYLFVDIYKSSFVFFEYKKIAELAKKQVFQKCGFPIEIREIVIADIDEPQTASIYEEIHQPCHNFQTYTDYPAVYSFENGI
tara:strand:- start:52 stop:468 length:417 start_codon:yes stop_codon:yes gene_type:complete